jgi:hypothetical protein
MFPSTPSAIRSNAPQPTKELDEPKNLRLIPSKPELLQLAHERECFLKRLGALGTLSVLNAEGDSVDKGLPKFPSGIGVPLLVRVQPWQQTAIIRCMGDVIAEAVTADESRCPASPAFASHPFAVSAHYRASGPMHAPIEIVAHSKLRSGSSLGANPGSAMSTDQ